MLRMTHTPSLALLAATLMVAGCPGGPYPPGPTPRPSAADFDQDAEATQLASALAGTTMRGYFEPGKLVNDGVGIFSTEGDGEVELPRRWGRSYPKMVQAAGSVIDDMTVTFRRNGYAALTADATFSVTREARFVADFPYLKKLVTKNYLETSARLAHFEKQDGTWRLLSLSPMTLQSRELLTTIAQARLRWSDGDLAVTGTSLVPTLKAPVLAPRATASLEVTAGTRASAADAAPVLFAYLPPGRERIRLKDDGAAPDRVAGDRVYSATVAFPATAGPGHLVVEAVAGTTFLDLADDVYDGAIWGMSYLISGGVAQ